MKFLGQFIVRVADLLEAEARLARRGAYRFVAAVILLLAAAALLLVGTFTLAAAVYLALRRVLPADATCAVIGGILVAIGFAAVNVAADKGKPR